MKKRRIYLCNTAFIGSDQPASYIQARPADPPPELPAMPPHPPDDGAPRPKWNSKWDFDRGAERVRIVVVAHGTTGTETMDAREFIERLGGDHRVTTFAIHVETEQIGASHEPKG